MAGLSVNNITLPQRQDKIRYRIDFSVPRFHSLCLTTFCPLQPWLRDTAERERMANNIGLQLQLSRSIRATYHTHNLRYPSGAGDTWHRETWGHWSWFMWRGISGGGDTQHKLSMIMQPCPPNVVIPSWNWQFLQCYVSVEPIRILNSTLYVPPKKSRRKKNKRETWRNKHSGNISLIAVHLVSVHWRRKSREADETTFSSEQWGGGGR